MGSRADSAVRHLRGRHDLPGCGERHRRGPGAARSRGRRPGTADVLRSDAPELAATRTVPRGSRAGSSRPSVSSTLVVAPSSSCVGHDPRALPGAVGPLATRCSSAQRSSRSSSSTGSAIDDVGARFPHRVAYHPTCHSLRVTRVGDAPLRLLRHVRELELVELADERECCGFGGTFAVKNAETSSAMLADKCDAIAASGAEICTAVDGSCLLQIGGRPVAPGVDGAGRPPGGDPRSHGEPPAERFPLAARHELANPQLRANLRAATDDDPRQARSRRR